MTIPDPSTLRDLQRRIREAKGDDRELDVLIWAALQGVQITTFKRNISGSLTIGWDGTLQFPDWPGQPQLTSSIDLAVSLVERLLPGWCWDVARDCKGEYEAGLTAQDWKDQGDRRCGAAFHVRAPLAILGALCTALLAQAEAGSSLRRT